MKKLLAVILAADVLFASFSVCSTAFAVKTTDVAKTPLGNSSAYYEYCAETKTLTISGSGAIPNMTNNDASQPWFYWRSDGSIENIVVEEGITGIGSYAFYQVAASSISLPSTLKTVSGYAFAYNLVIESIDIPFGVLSLGISAFENCISLKSVSIPDTVIIINRNTFKQCYKLDDVVIPHSVTNIGNNAFYRCSELSQVHFESLSTKITFGSYVFQSCPKLSEISVPLNAKTGKQFFGYNEQGGLYEDISMKVFSGSPALTYAVTNSIDYSLIGRIPLELGAVNKNEYVDGNVNNSFVYSFTPEVTQKYNIYSEGEVDLRAVISDENGEIASADDISAENLNFCLNCELEAGREYIITVNSVKSTGEYSVIAYPDEIEAFDIKGALSFSADEGELKDGVRYFDITDDMLSDFILSIDFGGGFKDKIYYESKFFDNREITLSDKQSELPFTCGDNSSYISIGEPESSFNVHIDHSYSEEVIEMTVDDDGYSIFTCILCGDSYKGSFVPTTAVTVSGKAVLMERPDGSHEHNIPYPHASFKANNRTYYIDEEGKWSVNTFGSLDLVFENENGADIAVHIDVDGENVDYGTIAFEGYDFNGDSCVNAKDFAVFVRQKRNTMGNDYFKYAVNFI